MRGGNFKTGSFLDIQLSRITYKDLMEIISDNNVLGSTVYRSVSTSNIRFFCFLSLQGLHLDCASSSYSVRILNANKIIFLCAPKCIIKLIELVIKNWSGKLNSKTTKSGDPRVTKRSYVLQKYQSPIIKSKQANAGNEEAEITKLNGSLCVQNLKQFFYESSIVKWSDTPLQLNGEAEGNIIN